MAMSKEHKLPLDLQLGDKDAASPRGLMPPYVVLRYFLDETTVAGLFAFALSKQPDFAPTRVVGKAVDPSIRISNGLRELGGYRPLIKDKILGLVPGLIARLQVAVRRMRSRDGACRARRRRVLQAACRYADRCLQ
jgi:hypothetical protein